MGLIARDSNNIVVLYARIYTTANTAIGAGGFNLTG
jgi:hypothetical protein